MTEARTRKWTILEVLDWTRGHFENKGIDSPRLDAEVLIAHALGLQRVMLYAKHDTPLDAEELQTIRELVARRARAEPVAHLIGKREFWSKSFTVTKDTLVPRPDTETLIEAALDLRKGHETALVVDVGTGTGCIAITLALEIPDARVFGLEISEAARDVADSNIREHGLESRVVVLASDLLHALPSDLPRIDLLAANLPYVRTDELPGLMTDVRDYEPHLALDGGDDGLDSIRRLIDQAPERMASGGTIALEADPAQHEKIGQLLAAAGFADVAIKNDTAGDRRVTTARWP